jgi:hypothetical protein
MDWFCLDMGEVDTLNLKFKTLRQQFVVGKQSSNYKYDKRKAVRYLR